MGEFFLSFVLLSTHYDFLLYSKHPAFRLQNVLYLYRIFFIRPFLRNPIQTFHLLPQSSQILQHRHPVPLRPFTSPQAQQRNWHHPNPYNTVLLHPRPRSHASSSENRRHPSNTFHPTHPFLLFDAVLPHKQTVGEMRGRVSRDGSKDPVRQ